MQALSSSEVGMGEAEVTQAGSPLSMCQTSVSGAGGARLVTEVCASCRRCLEEVAWGAARMGRARGRTGQAERTARSKAQRPVWEGDAIPWVEALSCWEGEIRDWLG